MRAHTPAHACVCVCVCIHVSYNFLFWNEAKLSDTAHVKHTVASIWEKGSACEAVSLIISKCELIYCDRFCCFSYSWELVWPSCYQSCVSYAYAEWFLHASVSKDFSFPSPGNICRIKKAVWGTNRRRETWAPASGTDDNREQAARNGGECSICI
jgi:hypothetical protein